MGLDETEAGALLLTQRWKLAVTDDILIPAIFLSKNLGDSLIGCLGFSKRIGIEKKFKLAFLSDSFISRHECPYLTAAPFTAFARKPMTKHWAGRPAKPADLLDASFACYYASLISPIAIDAWLMLAELKQLGFCPDIDQREHATEGISAARDFLNRATNIDDEFRALLVKGMNHLSNM
jgi:hypothetical protein